MELRFEINENKYKKVSSKLVSTCPIATVANAASYKLISEYFIQIDWLYNTVY